MKKEIIPFLKALGLTVAVFGICWLVAMDILSYKRKQQHYYYIMQERPNNLKGMSCNHWHKTGDSASMHVGNHKGLVVAMVESEKDMDGVLEAYATACMQDGPYLTNPQKEARITYYQDDSTMLRFVHRDSISVFNKDFSYKSKWKRVWASITELKNGRISISGQATNGTLTKEFTWTGSDTTIARRILQLPQPSKK